MYKPNAENLSHTINETKILENIAKWQAVQNPLTPLTEHQMDIIYKIEDKIKDIYYKSDVKTEQKPNIVIDNLSKYSKWLVYVENEMKYESLANCISYGEELGDYDDYCEQLCSNTDQVINSLKDLQTKYKDVSQKTNSLHNLSDQLMKDQKILKDKKTSVAEKLQYFTLLYDIQENFKKYTDDINSDQFTNVLDSIDKSVEFFCEHTNFKEANSYKLRFKSLLAQACQAILKHFTSVIADSTKHVLNVDKTSVFVAEINKKQDNLDLDAAGSFYYGKFQNAATKVHKLVNQLEIKSKDNNIYHITLIDCQRTYFAHRSPIITSAVSKALLELREKHRTDQGVLFRSSGFFVMKVCEDETACFYYYFKKSTQQLSEYLCIICEILYDVLRPSLISINHLEVLTELCTSLKEMLNDQVQNNEVLDQFVIVGHQLLHDVEERLVFRANVFFQNDLRSYNPSSGDLAYPEKLEQMENIIEELIELNSDSHSSAGSVESQEVANISSNYSGQFRSYTGNSAADLHGMWYPTVKRTLVCLSRLYLCLDREIFQGLAQEALLVCVETIETAANKISAKKSVLDAKLFQIKHLLIIREQIAPFQVDFTVKETSLDFSNVRQAAVGLVQNRRKLFKLNSNNAFLEFLLEGTPTVREYLIDSRKEIDKQLKLSCESFIAHTTQLLIGHVQQWIEKAEHVLKLESDNIGMLKVQEFAKPQTLAGIINTAQRNIKTKIPSIQKSMKLYLSNRETEFILFRPIKNNLLYCFMHVEQILTKAKYTTEEKVLIACPSSELLNVMVSSVSLTSENSSTKTTPKAIS